MRNGATLSGALLSGALLLAGSTTAAWGEVESHGPAQVDLIAGTTLHRVTLTERAAARIGIQTGTVSDREIERSHRIAGEVLAPPYPEALLPFLSAEGNSAATLIQASQALDSAGLALGHIATVRQTGKAGATEYHAARLIAVIAADAPDQPDELFFAVDGAGLGLDARRQVLVAFTLTEAQRMTIPSTALFYDAGGAAWVFVNPEPLVYMRHAVAVDFVQQDWAVLTDGPPAGTAVVTRGAMLLLGTEFGMGH